MIPIKGEIKRTLRRLRFCSILPSHPEKKIFSDCDITYDLFFFMEKNPFQPQIQHVCLIEVLGIYEPKTLAPPLACSPERGGADLLCHPLSLN